jgi:predicted dehydrogenase
MYRAGIIGLGFVGAGDQASGDILGQRVENLDGNHFAAYNNHPRIEIVCGSSRDTGRRNRFADRSGARVYAAWREMLRSHDLDIVSIATYTPVHKEMTIACADAGIPVIYCEKPIAQTVADARRMLKRCNDTGSLLVINHNRRFNPNFRRLRSLIDAGGLGKLITISVRWGSGRLGNIGTHVFDAVMMLSGQVPAAVSGTLDNSAYSDCRGKEFYDPGGWGLIRLEGGCMVMVDAANQAKCPMVIDLQGTEGSASVHGREVTITTGDKTELWPDETGDRSSMDAAVDEIIGWLDNRKTNGPTGVFSYDPAEAVGTLETIAAFHVSDTRSSAWVDLPLKSRDRDLIIRSG